MQVTEVANEGLKRAYTVVVPAGDIAAEREKRLAQLGRELRLPGFRPGKIPPKVVQQRYGQAVMGEVLEQSVNNATQQVVTDRGLRPALQPKIELVNFNEGADLEFKVELEVMPEVPMPDFAGIEVERLKAEPSEEQVSKALESIAQRNRKLEDVTEERGAQKSEVAVCDFVGRLVTSGENLLGNPGMEGAEAGEPGRMPRQWAANAPEGMAWAVIGRGEEEGLPWLDLRLSGTAARRGNADIFLDRPIAASSGQSLDVSARWRLVSGELPAGTRAAFFLRERSDETLLKDNRVDVAEPGAAPLAEQAVSGEVTLSGGEAVTYVRPVLGLMLPEGAAIDAVIRIAAPSLTRAGSGGVGEPFPGGNATDMPIEVAGEGFIPGFTEQLEGIRPGETRTIDVTFPAEYGAKELAGKPAQFEVTCKALKKPVLPALDDEFAKSLGFEDLGKLKDAVRESLQREYDSLSRLKVKRALLDALASRAEFAVPEGMVEAEFSQIWQRIEADLKAGRLDEDDKDKDEATLKEDYRKIAERRIRLGLLLSEIGRTNNITVSSEELGRAMRQEASRYPGQEQQVMEFFRKNPQAAENLRSPIFEEKVVDFMLELAKVTDRGVTPEELSAAAGAA